MSGRAENAKTLAAIAGISNDEAESLLEASILITSSNDEHEAWFATTLQAIVERTFDHCRLEPIGDEVIEIVIGAAEPRLSIDRVWVNNASTTLVISSGAPTERRFERIPRPLGVVAACYAASFVTKRLLPADLPYSDDPNVIDLSEVQLPEAGEPSVRVRKTFLAGAGAIGNAFLWTLRHFDVSGELAVYDPDSVSEGNLNRQIYFKPDDVGHNKASKLVERAQVDFPYLKLRPSPLSLQAALPKLQDDRWLETVIVGVDSRRARRHIQSELPKRVFDASTTGIAEVVVHFNAEPNSAACMGCIYHETAGENARERHVAGALGVSLEELQENWISSDAARRIVAKYPSLNAADITGEVYDSLFKALCGQQLLEHNGKQILAPFAFVSILAGALLAIEFVRRSIGTSTPEFNLWKVSPWTRPMRQLQRQRPSLAECEFCNDEIFRAVRGELWGQ